MDKKFELTELMLQYNHSQVDGWRMTKGNRINGLDVDCIFRKEDAATLVLSHMLDPYVSKLHVGKAEELQKYFSAKHQLASVKVVMVYGRLLMNPHRLPENISIFSIMDSAEPEMELDKSR